MCRDSYKSLYEKVKEVIIGPISFEPMKDPVLTPSGITYERRLLEVALRIRNIDPVSNIHLQKQQLYPNLLAKSIYEIMKKSLKEFNRQKKTLKDLPEAQGLF